MKNRNNTRQIEITENIHYDISISEIENGEVCVRFYEVYATYEDFIKHRQTEHYKKWCTYTQRAIDNDTPKITIGSCRTEYDTGNLIL
jgi:quinol monooxygenase YgiN